MTDDNKMDVKRMGVIDARVNGGNYATINHDTNSSQKNTPIAPTTTAKQPQVERTTDFVDMYKANTTAPMTDEQRTKQQKRQRRQQTLSAIIDGISALGNVYFASRGAGANGTTNMSGAVSDKWTKYWDEAKADKKEYNKGLLAAQQLDYNTYLRRLERAEDKAERDARAANAEKWRQKDYDLRQTQANQQQSNWQKTFDANEAHRLTQNEISRKQLEIAQQNARIAMDKAKGEFYAYDEKGKIHWFQDEKAADAFAHDHGTMAVYKTTKTTTKPSDFPGEPPVTTTETYDKTYRTTKEKADESKKKPKLY